MFKAYHIRFIFDQVIPKLTHENDGLIFTPRADPYVSGTCHRMLKWKPASLNTVDFRVELFQGICKLQVLKHKGKHEDYALLADHPQVSVPILKSGQIIECLYQNDAQTPIIDEKSNQIVGASPGGWTFMRIRNDKGTGNADHVVAGILDSIRDNVTQEQLISRSEGIHKAWKKRETCKF